MNKRQSEILADLKNQFELINSRKDVGSTLINISAIVQDLDDSKLIRQEIELQNKILRKELYAEFVSKLKQVQAELKTIGIISELRDEEHNHNLHIGKRPDYNLFYDAAFYISTYEEKDGIGLPDGGYIEKFTKLQIHIRHGVYFDTVDELVKTQDFIDRIKKLAR
jgi:hypothetical protein